jgi:hypothetical protein
MAEPSRSAIGKALLERHGRSAGTSRRAPPPPADQVTVRLTSMLPRVALE